LCRVQPAHGSATDVAQRPRAGRRPRAFVAGTDGGLHRQFLDHQPINTGDCMVVYSRSGRNAAGIEAALYGKKRELFVVAVTSRKMLDTPATHSCGNRLADAADSVIDTCAPVEGAIVKVDGWTRPVAGSSTVMAVVLTHEVLARTAASLAA